MSPNKSKGKRFEYEIRNFFKENGFTECIISSSESTNADNMGIDLLNLPFIVQCKNGYKSGLKYQEILTYINKKTKNTKYDGLLIFIFHKNNRKTEVTSSLTHYLEFTNSKDKKLIVDKEAAYFCRNYDNTITVDFNLFKKHLQKWIILKE